MTRRVESLACCLSHPSRRARGLGRPPVRRAGGRQAPALQNGQSGPAASATGPASALSRPGAGDSTAPPSRVAAGAAAAAL